MKQLRDEDEQPEDLILQRRCLLPPPTPTIHPEIVGCDSEQAEPLQDQIFRRQLKQQLLQLPPLPPEDTIA